MSVLLAAESAPSGASHGELFATLQALAALLLMGSLVWLVLRIRRAASFSRRAQGKLELEERLPLELGSALVIVRVERRRLLLATSDHGPPRLLTELAADEPSRDLPSTHANGPASAPRESA